MTDSDPILRARQGDSLAWENLVYAHQEAVFRLAYLFLGDADEAQDVAQETFIRAYRALDRFDETRPLRPWFLSIAANLARNQKRASGRYLAALSRFISLEPHQAGYQAEQAASDDANLLWQAIRRLHPRDQEALYLRFFLEMPEAEMAVSLSVPPGTVKSRLHRALDHLRKVIDQAFPALREDFMP